MIMLLVTTVTFPDSRLRSFTVSSDERANNIYIQIKSFKPLATNPVNLTKICQTDNQKSLTTLLPVCSKIC